MNLQPYNLNYQDGLNTYPIIDYINDQIGIGGGGTGGGINSYVYLYQSSNLMIANNTSNTGIYFRVYNSPNATNGNYPYSVKIDKDGKLYVYHLFDLLNPTMGAGWYDVEKEIANAIFNTIQTNIQFLAIEGEIVVLTGAIATNQTNFNNFKNLTNASLTKVSDSLEVIGNSFQALTTEATTDAIFRASGSISAYVNNSRALFSVQRSFIDQMRVGLGNVANVVTNPFLVAGVGISASIFGMILGNNSFNYNDRFDTNSNGDFTLDETTRTQVRTSNYSNILQFTSNFITDMSNVNITFGFINSNVTTTQFIPTLKSNKVLLGNITTPNASYQMEMTGDLNTNMLWINSVSLTSLLNQKQDNMSATQPIYITSSTIGLNYDSSLTKIGNNLSVVKTATTPLVWTGNNLSLNYDATLTKIGNNLSVASATASKWTTTGNNIYNNNIGNVGINDTDPQTRLSVQGDTYISGITTLGQGRLNPIASYTGATLTLATGTSEYYLQYTGNGTLVLNEPCACDLFIVGAGGYGGNGASSGGGGAGEVIYYQNFPLRNGTLTINVGTASATIANRISSITHSSGTQISAKGGGDGGIPDYLFTSGGSITVSINATALFNYTDSVSIAPATYTVSFSNGNITLTGLSANRSFPLLKSGSTTIDPYIWYKFEDTYNYLVDSGSTGTFTLTNNGSTFDTTNYVRGYGSIVVDTGKNVSIASNINFYNIQTTNGITFSLWVKLTGGTTYGRLFHFSGTDQSNDGMCCICRNAGGNGIQLNLWTTGSNRAIVYDSSYNYFNNTWYFLTWSISSSGVWSYYVNGVSVTITATTFNFVSTKSYNVNKVIGGNYLSEYVTGNVDDFRIYAKELTATEVLELYKGRVVIYSSPKSGGSGGGGAKNQTGSSAGVKFDDYKSFALSGLSGNTTTGGNGGCGNTTYTRYTTTITGSSLSVGLGGTGVGTTPATPTTKTNYGDGGDGNGGIGAGGIVIIRFKVDTNYLQVKAIKDNANSGLILNANESPNAYQLRVYPWSDTYQLTGVATRGWSFRCHDGNNNLDLLNLFSSFGGRIGIKTKNPSAILDVNGDVVCKTFSVIGNELYGITCQIVNQHNTGEANITVSAGASGNYGAMSLVYLPSDNLGYINCSKSLKIKTGNDALNSYIYIDNNSGYVGIGITNPQSKLELIGDIHSTSMTASTGNFNSISTYGLALNNGNITGVNRVNSVDVWTGPVKATSLDLAGGNITNGGFFYGMAQQARFLNMSVNEWHYDTQSRNRFYFTNDTTTPSNSHTVFRTGSTTHYFQDKDGIDYCLLDRFGISTYFEVISGGAYDNVGVADGVSSGVYVYRRMILRLSTFTEVHRCFCEDELYTNYDNFINEYVGRIVVSKGKIKTALKEEGKQWEIFEGKDGITIDDSHPVIQLSRKRKDKGVIGVITKRNQNNDIPNRLVINSLGEGAVWVVNTNGDFEIGDFIQTSNEVGYGERQDDDIVHNYTLGKSMIDCSFELDSANYKCEQLENGIRRAFIPVFYYSG